MNTFCHFGFILVPPETWVFFYEKWMKTLQNQKRNQNDDKKMNNTDISEWKTLMCDFYHFLQYTQRVKNGKRRKGILNIYQTTTTTTECVFKKCIIFKFAQKNKLWDFKAIEFHCLFSYWRNCLWNQLLCNFHKYICSYWNYGNLWNYHYINEKLNIDILLYFFFSWSESVNLLIFHFLLLLKFNFNEFDFCYLWKEINTCILFKFLLTCLHDAHV